MQHYPCHVMNSCNLFGFKAEMTLCGLLGANLGVRKPNKRQHLAANLPPCRGKRHLNLTHLKGDGSVATTELLAGTDIHTLARQMGTSVLMLEKHYSKLTATMAAEQLA